MITLILTDNTKSPVFDGVQDLIFAMSWFSNVEGYFFTCSRPTGQKVKCSPNLLRAWAKDWWRLVTGSYTAE